MKILKAGEVYEPFGECRVVRLLSNTEVKSTYEVEWEGSSAILKLSQEPPLVPESHPVWATILTREDLPGSCAFLQEKLTGSSLATVLNYGKPSLPQRVGWLLELCRFFETACPSDAVVEPANVLISESGQLRVVSLGREKPEETPISAFGRLIETTLPDSTTAVWLAARCKEQRVTQYTEIANQLVEFLHDDAPVTLDLPLSEIPHPRPWPWTGMLVALSIAVFLGAFWSRPVTRSEPAIYLSKGRTIQLFSESSTQSLGSFRTEDSVSAMVGSSEQNRLYIAYDDSPYVEILDATNHQAVGRILTQPGATKLFLEADTVGALYPQLRLFVLLKTDGESAFPISLPEGSVSVALGQHEAAVSLGKQLEVYRLEPFSLLFSGSLESECSALWSEEGKIRLAQGAERYEFDSSDTTLKRLKSESPEPQTGLTTPHGYWTLEAEKLSKLTERDGTVLATWPADSDSALTYLESNDAP